MLGLGYLFETLPRCRLTQLDLNSSAFTDSGLQILSTNLPKTNLTHLNLKGRESVYTKTGNKFIFYLNDIVFFPCQDNLVGKCILLRTTKRPRII